MNSPARTAVIRAVIVVILAGATGLALLRAGPSLWGTPGRTSLLPPQQAVRLVAFRPDAPAQAALTFSERFRATLDDVYRLRPDRRFLLAVAEVHHLVSGRPRESIEIGFVDGRWHLRYAGLAVGTLPPLPDFPDATALLTGWARTVCERYPLELSPDTPSTLQADIDRHLTRFLAPHVAAAGRMIDAEWRDGLRTPWLLRAVVRALVMLNVQMWDRMETADVLPARALAALALTRGLTEHDTGSEEALLAETMGYSAHAERVARTLPERDAVRFFAGHDDEALMLHARSDEAGPQARYLALVRIAQLKRVGAYVEWVRSFFRDAWWSPSVFKAGLELNQFSSNRVLAETLPSLVLLALAEEAGLPTLTTIIQDLRNLGYPQEEVAARFDALQELTVTLRPTLMEHFESGLGLLKDKYPGPFVDAQVYGGYYRAHFFSSYYVLGLHYLDSLSSAEAAAAFAATLGSSESGVARDFRRWYDHLTASKAGRGNLTHLIADLRELWQFGQPPLLRTFEEQGEHFRFGDPAVPKAVKLLVARMDTRVAHRFDLARIARKDLLDAPRADALFRSVIDAAPADHAALRVWHAGYTDDVGQLTTLLRLPALLPAARANVLGELERMGAMRKAQLRREYRALIESGPTDWSLQRSYLDYLERIGKYEEARAVAAAWLGRKVPTAGLEPIFATTTIARMYYHEGRYQEGLDVILPVVPSQQFGALQRAALLLEKLGRYEEAESLARSALDRYPTSLTARTLLMRILWGQGRHDEAASVATSTRYRIAQTDWRFSVGPEFLEAFEGRPDREARNAFAALLDAGVSHLALQQLALAVFQTGHAELAFHMQFPLKGAGAEHVQFLIKTYTYLEAWRGPSAALEWLRPEAAAFPLDLVALAAYEDGEYELLWDLIERPEDTEYPDSVWLLRAAAAITSRPATPSHRQALLNYYATHKTSPYDVMGRYLLGLVSREAVLALVTDQKRQCEVAYFLGLRAEAEGRYDDASDWYRVVIETGMTHDAEYHWAFQRLYVWYTRGKHLSLLAADEV